MTLFESQTKKWLVLIGVSTASFLGCIDFTIVNTALPAIQGSLHASVTELQWVMSIFSLALATCMVMMGRLADIYGRRLLLYIGMIAFGLASLGAGLSMSIDWLILFRLMQGIFCAILYTASGAIISNAFPANERGKAMGALFGINGVGLAIGPVLGGFIVSVLNWRWIFLVNVPIILMSLFICVCSVTESRNREDGTSIDWLGLMALMIGLSCLILGITQGNSWGWHSSVITSLLSTAILMLVLFYFIEQSVRAPIIQFHLFANRLFIVGAVATFTLALFYCTAFFLMPLYLHNILNETAGRVGLMLLPTTAMVALLSPIIGKITDRHGPRKPLLAGLLFFMISALLQANLTDASSLCYILSAFIFIGIGWACILGPSTVAALSSVPDRMSAVAMGSSWTIHNIGGAVGLGVGVAMYRESAQNTLLDELANHHVASYHWAAQIVSNPELTIQTLGAQTQLSTSDVLSVFHRFFLAGYSSAMEFLAICSLAAWLVVFFLMRKK